MLFNSGEANTRLGTSGAAELATDHLAGARAIDDPVQGSITVAIIDRRTLGRETLTQALASADGHFRSRAFADIDEWESSSYRSDTSLILLECGTTCECGGACDGGPSFDERLLGVVRAHPDIPVVVIGDEEDPRRIAEILGQGARGYIPTSVRLNVAIGALRLAMAGGIFIPPSALQNSGRGRSEPQRSVHCMLGLSERQAVVANAVALGKPNKTIAYELDLSENTVKVHIRSIMKKLQARNRTEIAFKLHAAKNGSLSSRRAHSAETHAA